MKAVYSYFSTTDDILYNAKNWKDPKFHLYSWVLSTFYTRRQFDQIQLVTDDQSARVFEKLKLPFTQISTELNQLRNYDKDLWALGKVIAYSIQQEPFIHIDNDVILIKPIQGDLLSGKILLQNIEHSNWFRDFYLGILNGLKTAGVDIYNPETDPDWAWNMGIYGCNDLEFNQYYTDVALKLVNEQLQPLSGNRRFGTLYWTNVIFEQWILGKCMLERKIEPNTLFSSVDDAHNRASETGYVHIWGAKGSDTWREATRRRVMNEFPEQYEIIESLIK